MAVIWDFEPTTGMTGAAIQPEEKPADHMVSVPRLAFDEVSCNCTQFPCGGDIVRTPDTGAIAARLQNLDLSGIPDVYGIQMMRMTRPVKVDHFQSWSRIFWSDQTEMVRSI